MADRLIEARVAAGYESAAAAAEEMDVPKPTYSAHENGSRGFWDDARKYAHFFGVNVLWLLYGTGAMKSGQKDPLQAKIDRLTPSKRIQAIDFIDYLDSKDEE